MGTLSESEATDLSFDWDFWARRNQLAPPGNWSYWLILAGRGFGKTRSGAEWVIRKAHSMPHSHGALVAATAEDARKTMLSAESRNIEGASGILAVSPPWFMPTYEPSLRQLKWPNGSMATLYTAEEPDRLRGPQHYWGWVDEIAAWGKQQDAWDQLIFGMRLGDHPQFCVTTTPRPVPLLRRLIKDPRAVITRGSTYDNAANVSASWLDTVKAQYEGTRLGRQELMGEILDDVPGALWRRSLFDDNRRHCNDLLRIVVAIDPAVTNTETSDETGIIVAGRGVDGHAYVMDDLSCKLMPHEWIARAVRAYEHYRADCVVAEVNNGGDLILSLLATIAPNTRYKDMHASRGKITRAEPIAAMYEQGRVHHVREFVELEDQCCNYAPLVFPKSPDRMDALVWALTELFLSEQPQTMIYEDRVRISRY